MDKTKITSNSSELNERWPVKLISGYYMNGVNFEGPAPRPLERYKIYLKPDGKIAIDKTKVFRHEKGEWDNPDSFIQV